MSKKTAKVEAQTLNRVDALNILREAIGNDADAEKALDVFTRVNKRTDANDYGLKDEMVLNRSSKAVSDNYIGRRVEMADGMTIAEAMKTVPNGHHGSYRLIDIRYDIEKTGTLLDPRS
tara:strand:- start:33 stop:389 length:357 start_codon:yes stop_codon:yes gene_type:complete